MLTVTQLIGFAAGGTAFGTTPPTPTDDQFNNVVLLLGFDGVDGVNFGPGFADESLSQHGEGGLSAIGPVITATQKRYGPSALSLPNSGGLGWADSTDWNFSAGLYTIEASVYFNTTGAGVRAIIGQWVNVSGGHGWTLAQSGQTLIWRVSTTGTDSFTDLTSPATFANNTWYDVAVDFDGLNTRLYINGAVVASTTTARTIFNSTGSIVVGHSSGSGGTITEVFNGVIDELRITKGVARYHGVTYIPYSFPRRGGTGINLPVNTARPVVSGTTAVGYTLTGTNGTWTGPPPITFAYQWQRDGVDISGATSITYLLSSADIGKAIKIKVTATNSSGSSFITSSNTNLITSAPVIRPLPLYDSDTFYQAVIVGGVQPPLDGLSGVTGAWSMSRKLLSSYSGAWHTDVSGMIDVWKDHTSFAHDLSHDIDRPGQSVAGPNSRACLTFNGTTQGLSSSSKLTAFMTTTDGYVIASFITDRTSSNNTDTFANDTVWADQGGSVGAHIKNGNIYGFNWYFGENLAPSTGVAVSTGTTYVCEWWHTGGVLYFRVNGGTTYTVTSGNSYLQFNLNVGRSSSDSDPFLQGKIFEMATFSVVPNSTARDALMLDFKTWVGLAPLSSQTLVPSAPVIDTDVVYAASMVGAAAYATWDGTATNMTMTGGNLIAQHANTTLGDVRSTTQRTTGKYYFEITINNISDPSSGIGIATAAASSFDLFSMSNASGIYNDAQGHLITNGVIFGNLIGALATNDVIGFAVDLVNNKLWARKAPSGNWNGQLIGSQNPATNTGGENISAFNATTVAPVVSFSGSSSQKVTLNAGQTAFVGTPPSGFTAGWQ